jgi:ribosomal protein L37AE/L43A
MQSLIDSYKNTGTLHHAYVVEGETDHAYKNVCDFCEKDLNMKRIKSGDKVCNSSNASFASLYAKTLLYLALNISLTVVFTNGSSSIITTV